MNNEKKTWFLLYNNICFIYLNLIHFFQFHNFYIIYHINLIDHHFSIEIDICFLYWCIA